MEPVLIEVGITGLQTFNIREKEEAIQRVFFEHLFLCDFFVLFSEKESSTTHFSLFLKLSLQLFQRTLMKKSMTEFGSALGR